MQSFFSDPGGVGREVALNSLRRDIVGLIGGPARLHDALFLDAPIADFFATVDNRLYLIRWIDSHEFAGALTRTLSELVRLNQTGRPAAARFFGLPEDFPSPTLVLVSDRLEEDWVRVVSLLRVPVMLLRAHSLVDGTRHSAGCLFEKRFASAGDRIAEGHRPPGTAAPRPPLQAAPRRDDDAIVPGPSAHPGPAADLRLAAVDLDEPVAPLADIHPDEEIEAVFETTPDRGGATGQPPTVDSPSGRGASIGPEDARPEPADASASSPAAAAEVPAEEPAAPPSSPSASFRPVSDWSAPRSLLSDEEAATFKLLETMLQSRN